MRALLYLLTLTLCCFLKNGYCVITTFEEFKADPRTMFLVEQYNKRQIENRQELLNKIELKMSLSTLKRYLRKLTKETGDGRLAKMKNGGGGSRSTPPINSTAETENFLSRAYQNLLLRQHAETIKSVPDSFWFHHDVTPQSATSTLNSVVSSWSGASQQAIPQFPPSMHDTQLSAASSYYPSNQPDDGTLESMFKPRNPSSSSYYPPNQSTPLNSSTDFVPFQAETHFTNWFGEDSHNGDGTLESVVNSRKPSSSKSASKGSPSYYRDAVPYQQAPMPDTSLSEFPHHPFNQPAPLNSSTNFVSSQTETEMHPWDWPCGDLYNDVGTLESMFKPKNP